ncbi:TIGR03862 family flavoprotein [Devosia sp.]|uniref:TIGR03862 family flavoprotein n=1 Tax=Devosia sp. TaxID=1871048 RepID=UPI0025DA813A|nr:TIGR03862 family flavoprotein [Devosia sp.]MCR6636741.1 TIGR03862 family flavoprotein [Devosia sp.]
MSQVAIIGGGPAGLMAAEVLADAGLSVTLFEAMPTVGRKLLMAGKSGLNITHAEDHASLLTRYGAALPRLQKALDAFTSEDLRNWCSSLGIETFVGSSNRVFPKTMKASPLLRAWLGRLNEKGVAIHTRHRWAGFDGKKLRFETPGGEKLLAFDAVLLALGGASWPKLGSDAAWVPWLVEKGVAVEPFQPANCGFEVEWSAGFIERFAGSPLKSVTATSPAGTIPGEFVVNRWGIEGSLVYAHSAALRDALLAGEPAVLDVDLMPGRSRERLAKDLARQPTKLSFSNRLRKGAGLDPVKAALLRECLPQANTLDPDALAAAIKSVPIRPQRPRPIAEVISSAGGVAFSGLDEHFMLNALPGVFAAGEMLDWEAPTGGYLLTASLATGRAAAEGLLDYVKVQR